MRFGVVALDRCFDSGLTAITDVLSAGEALRPLIAPHMAPISVARVGINNTATTASGLIVPIDVNIVDAASQCDVVVVPALAGTTEDDALSALRLPGTVELVEHLRRWSITTPIRLAAACTGTFPLAEAGVLDGLNATTSWWLAPLFRRRYPNVILNMNSMVVHADNVTTSGAAFAHIDLALALLGSLSPQLSSMVSRYLVIDHRPSQSTYAILGHLAATDPIVQTFERHVRDNLASIEDITDVAATIGTNRRTLERHLKDTLGIGPKEFIRQLRVERATHLLRTSTLNTDHVAHEVGYATAASLRTAIRKHNSLRSQ
jgi:transcriptional regulator GlxA family with amidase domain